MRCVAIAMVITACSFSPNAATSGGDGPLAIDSPTGSDAVVTHDGPAGKDAPPADAPADAAPPPPTCLQIWEGSGTPTFTTPALLLPAGSNHNDRDPSYAVAAGSGSDRLVFARTDSSDNRGLFKIFIDGSGDPLGSDSAAAEATNHVDPENPSKVTFVSPTEIILSGNVSNGTSHNPELGDSKLTNMQFGTPTTTGFAAPDGDGPPVYDPTVYTNGSGGLDLYYSADVGGSQVIRLTQRGSGAATFGTPSTVISSDHDNADPTLTNDELVIIFTSDRTGAQGNDLWFARRAAVTDAFGSATQLGDLDGPHADGDAQLSPDTCTIYFSSDRANPGTYELYYAHLVISGG